MSRSRVRSVALVMAAVVPLSLVEVAAVPRPAGAAPAKPASPACPDSRADETSATVTARLCGKRVEVTGLTTETDRVWVNPKGSRTLEHRYRPVRVRRGSAWVGVDTTLVRGADGTVAAKAAAVDVRFSGGGTGPLVSVSTGAGEKLEVFSPLGGALPAPVLAGSSAVYPEVLPGVDLRVSADVDGFAEALLVKDRAASGNPKLAKLAFPTRSAGLTVAADGFGNLSVVNTGGGVLLHGEHPAMWDAAAERDGVALAGGGSRRREMPTEVGPDAISVTPDAGLLGDPNTQFPVEIDPGLTFAKGAWTMVDSGFATTSYLNSSGEAKSGTYNGGGNKLRSFFRMVPPFSMSGRIIISATFSLYETWAWSCSARQVDMWVTGPIGSGTTWNAQPSWMYATASVNAAKGYSSSCPAGTLDFNATNAVRDMANAGWPDLTLGIRSPNETDSTYWKKYANNPALTVEYDSYPQVTAMSTAPSMPCDQGANRPYVNTTTPTLQAAVADPDGQDVKARFWWEYTNGALIGQSYYPGGYGPSGSVFSATIPAGQFTDGGTYSWRVLGDDGYTEGPWSRWCEFTVDTVKPGAPFVSSTLYPSISTDNTWGHGGAGQAGQFTFTPPSGTADIVSYTYQLDTQTSPATVTAAGGSTPTTVSITPTDDGRRTLTVRGKDRAGNLSDPVTYVFNAGRAGLSLPQPGANVVKRSKLAVSGDPTLTRAVFQYRRGPGGVEYDVPLAHLRKADGSPVSGSPVRLADLGANGIWDAVDTLGTTGGVVQVRAALYPDADGVAAYLTQWTTVTVDTNGDGAGGDEVGPGSANLLTGDYTLSSTDADEFGLSSARTASSREPTDGWLPQGERLTANQQQISTDVTGFTNDGVAVFTRSTARGQGSSADSLQITPPNFGDTSQFWTKDTYVAVGGNNGALQLGMKTGRRYRFTGWIYVPAATGLTPDYAERGLRIMGFYRDAAGVYHEVGSVKAGWVDAWQELSVDLDIPAGATEAFFRLYNGMVAYTGKSVFFDNLSLKEVVAPFGPQWRGGAGDGIGSSDYTMLSFPSPELAEVSLAQGGWLTFGKGPTGSFFPEPGAEDLTLTRVNATTYRLSDLDGTVTEFSQQGTAFAVTATWTPDAASTSRYLYDVSDNRALVKRVINPVEPGVGDCTTATPARGCEVLEYDYATATTATGSVFGDVVDRVRAVKVWSWDPVAGAESAVEVARYAYDTSGRLREVWDPRLTNPIKTSYDYDGAGRVTKLTPAGQLPWMVDYTATPGDDNPGRLARVHRAALRAGTADVLDGEIATNVVYNVPLTKTAGGPHDMDAAAIGGWGQKDLPTDATALFGPETDPTTNSASATTPGSGGYTYATTRYLNASGQEVNTATPGSHIDSQQYDQYGNVVWTLQATNRELALGTLPDAAAKAADLNLPADSATRAQLLASITTYSADGLDLLDELGPVVKVALEHDLTATGQPTLPAGSQVVARGHTTHLYDEGKPDGAAYHLETTETAGGRVAGYPTDADTRSTHTGYAPVNGGASGWQLKKPTSTSTDAGSASVVYDSAGRPTQSWGIGSTGSDARATLSTYYTAGANSADTACGNKPEWAGQPCTTQPGGPITGQRPDMTSQLPVKRVEEYTRFGDTSKVAETAAGKTRRTTTSYDGADRVTSVEITSDEGVALPAVSTDYDPVSGQPTITHAGTATIIRGYDQLGRVLTYTDADGGVTRNEYDRYGKPTKATDNTGTTSFGYDRTVEPRGLLTSVTDSVAGTFTARYSPDGQLVELKYPGGMTRTDTLDASFAPVARAYRRDSDGQTIYNESVVENSQGQQVNHSYTGGSKTYGYDSLGRLTSVQQAAAGVCTTRAYAYDARTNRTAKRTYNPATDGSCRTAGTADAEEAHSYDTADRITDTGYGYDAFGRTTSLPGGLTTSFYANDLVAAQQTADTKQEWTLDPAHRFRGYTTAKLVDGAWANATSKLNHYGDDSDEPRWIVEDSSLGSITRNVSGPDSDLVATTSATGDVRLQLTNLHGDVAATIDPALTSPEFYDFDEFGIPTDGQTQQRYGWLGGKQRSADALGGVILMGVRLYSPNLGRFLQTDPEVGGNSNPYDYCSGDAVNCSDLDGKWGWGSIKKALKTVATVASYASMIPGPIGTIAGVVSAVAYVATGNWKEAAWAVGGALAATVGAGAAVKAARVAVTAVRASSKAARFGGWAAKAGRAGGSWGQTLGRTSKAAWGAAKKGFGAAKSWLANGNNYLRIGRHPATGKFRVSIGPAYNHYRKMGRLGKAFSPLHIHIERRYGGVDFNWLTRTNNKGKKVARNWRWWGK